MHSFLSRRPLSAFRCPAAAVAVPGPQLLRIALIDRPSHACTDMTHYIQVRCVSQARNAFRCNGQVQTQRHGQKHTKRTALPKGEGALPHNLSPALVEPPSVAEVLPSFAHALPMQASCLSSLHSQHHRALGNHRLCHRLSSSCLALLASLPHRPSLLVWYTGSPRWFATQAATYSTASPSSMPFVDTLLPTLKILPRFSELCHVLPSPCHTDSPSSLTSFA